MDRATRLNGTLTHDEDCLESMRQIVKEYIAYRHQQPDPETAIRGTFQRRYEEYRQVMRDDALRAFTAFELMEKLYWQEYLTNG